MLFKKYNVTEVEQQINWQDARAKALAQFSAQGFPTRREESWKYTNLSGLTDELIKPCPRPNDVSHSARTEASHCRLLVIDGYIDLARSLLPECVRVAQLNALDTDEYARDLINKLLPPSDDQPGHIALNTAHAAEGIFMHLMKGVRLNRPLEIQYITTSKAAGSSYTQVWLAMEPHSQASLIERFIGNDTGAQEGIRHCHNHVSRILLADGAELSHFRLQDAPSNCYHIYTAYLKLKHGSRYQSFSAYTGAALSRQEVRVDLQGEQVHCDQRGITVGRNNQHHDVYWPVEHTMPSSYSNQHFRQLLDDDSKGIFYGSVHVPEGSYKTKAHQLNRNLLLSSGAQSISRPELKIFNDDVVCSHGSTTGNLDQEAMYYLQTRGLSAHEAKMLLTQGFISEMLAQISDEYVRLAVAEQIELAMRKT